MMLGSFIDDLVTCRIYLFGMSLGYVNDISFSKLKMIPKGVIIYGVKLDED